MPFRMDLFVRPSVEATSQRKSRPRLLYCMASTSVFPFERTKGERVHFGLKSPLPVACEWEDRRIDLRIMQACANSQAGRGVHPWQICGCGKYVIGLYYRGILALRIIASCCNLVIWFPLLMIPKALVASSFKPPLPYAGVLRSKMR